MTQAPTVRVLAVSQSLALTVTGVPDVHNRHGSGHIRPSQVTLHYRGDRIRAHLYGLWVRADGELTDAPIDQDHAGPLEDWPDWLAALAREHQPDRAQPPAPDVAAAIVDALTERAGELSELAEEQMRPSLEERAQEWHEAAELARRVGRKSGRRLADEPQQDAG